MPLPLAGYGPGVPECPYDILPTASRSAITLGPPIYTLTVPDTPITNPQLCFTGGSSHPTLSTKHGHLRRLPGSDSHVASALYIWPSHPR